MCVQCIHMSVNTMVCVEVKGQLCGVGSLFPYLYGLQVLNSDHQALAASALPSEPSLQPTVIFLKLLIFKDR